MRKGKVVFKRYEQNQPMLVRVVNEIIERIDIGELEKTYKGVGVQLQPLKPNRTKILNKK